MVKENVLLIHNGVLFSQNEDKVESFLGIVSEAQKVAHYMVSLT